MTTVEALKELFTALGGSEEDVENIVTNPEMVHAIAEIAGNIGGLPEVTTADAGKVLTVSAEGEWEAASGDVVYIKADLKPSFKIEFRSHTQKDIFDYINSAVDVVIFVFDDENKLTYRFVFTSRAGSGQTLHAVFNDVFRDTNELSTTYITFGVYSEQTKIVPYEIKTLNDPA